MEKVRLIQLVCSDNRMDIRDVNHLLDTPVNHYMVRCVSCLFPEIDQVPRPYYITKRRCHSGVEIHLADVGNLLVSIRLKKIIETVLPGQCIFHKTYFENENVSTPWWLAEVKHQMITGRVNNSVKRCTECQQPLYAHGSQHKFWNHDFEGDYDIIKSENWLSESEVDWKKSWIRRDTLLSLRFFSLLKEVRVKGAYKSILSKAKPSSQDILWARNMLDILDPSLIVPPDNDILAADLEWLNQFLYERAEMSETKNQEQIDKLRSPSRYELEALTRIAAPLCLDRKDGIYLVPSDQWELNVGLGNKSKRKLISFAFDMYGNSWAFDASKNEGTIYWYDHEILEYEIMYNSVVAFLMAYAGPEMND